MRPKHYSPLRERGWQRSTRVFSWDPRGLGFKPTTLVPLDGRLSGRKAGNPYDFLVTEATSMIGFGIDFMARTNAATTFASNWALAQRSSSASASVAARAFLYVRSLVMGSYASATAIIPPPKGILSPPTACGYPQPSK